MSHYVADRYWTRDGENHVDPGPTLKPKTIPTPGEKPKSGRPQRPVGFFT